MEAFECPFLFFSWCFVLAFFQAGTQVNAFLLGAYMRGTEIGVLVDGKAAFLQIDAEKPTIRRSVSIPDRNISFCRVVHDGFVIATKDGRIGHVGSSGRYTLLYRIKYQFKRVEVAFISQILAIQGIDGSIELVDLKGKKSLYLINDDEFEVYLHGVSPEGNYVYFSDKSGSLYYYAVNKKRDKSGIIESDGSKLRSVVLSNDGRLLFTLSEKGRIDVWNVAEKDRVFSSNKRGNTKHAAFCGDSKAIVIALADNRMEILDLSKKNFVPLKAKFIGHMLYASADSILCYDSYRAWVIGLQNQRKPLLIDVQMWVK